MKYSYEYPRAATSTDCVVFGVAESGLEVLLIRRKHDPFSGKWALPGGFLDMGECLETCARRELLEETGIEVSKMWQIGAFGDVGRDPRGRVISIGFSALVLRNDYLPQASDDAAEAAWFSVRKPPPLAFDHDRFVATALDQLRERALNEPIGLELLPARFPLAALKKIYESVLDRKIDAGQFRRAIGNAGIIAIDSSAVGGQPWYRFDRRACKKAAQTKFDRQLFSRRAKEPRNGRG